VELLMEAADNPRPAPRRPSDMTAVFRPAAERIRLDAVQEVLNRVALMRLEIEGHSGDYTAQAVPSVRRSIRLVPGGYDIVQVQSLLDRAEQAVLAGGEVQLAWARQALRSVELTRRPVGYARGPVHRLIEELGRQLGVG
jgi:hypothetical protein